MSPVVRGVELVAIAFLAVWLLGQVRKPSGPLGKRVVRAMNVSHSALTDWGLRHLEIATDATVLDIGCGGGRTLQKLAQRAPTGEIHGIDISNASVAASRQTNAAEIASGRVRVEVGSVEKLPFADRTFDVITAVETHYYWPHVLADLREVFRVTKPGGTFAIIAETYRGGPMDAVYFVAMKLIRAAYLTDAEHRELLTQAGFTDVTTFHEPRTSWICATGKRPA